MARASRPLGIALVIAVLAQVVFQACQVFVGPGLSAGLRARSPSPVTLCAEEEETKVKVKKIRVCTPKRGIDLDGDKLDNLDEWYQETISGQGGMPKGFMQDLILRSYFGTWSSRGWFKMSRDYTGPLGQPSPADHETALENLKSNMKENKNFIGQDDGKGWIWLVAGQNPGGLYLYTMKSPPYGERPLALIKESNIDEFFDKVNWHMLFVRLHKWNLWGGKAIDFPYPMMWRANL
eukprot:gb/GFBE01055544.1/.p1 GENE.gb/GFBE01055544.1/~~gb/GFBE01055544.1/.p1  ORF type:complete len:236 (+),score=62.74 gb/GFBE01055544.1/:1-708(+)